MKKFLSTLVSFALIASAMSTTVFAASKADGSAASPFTDVPSSSIDGDTGTVTSSPKEIEVSGKKFGLSIMAIEKKQIAGEDGKSKWILTNPLTAPTSSTVKTEIKFASGDATYTMELKINNTDVGEGSYNFTVGSTQRMVLTVKDASKAKVGELYWDFTIPNNDKTAPVLKVTSKSGDIKIDDATGVITVSEASSTGRLVQFIAEDTGSGLASMQVQYFSDAARKNFSIEQPTHAGASFPCADVSTCPTKDCVAGDTLKSFQNVFGSSAIKTNDDTGAIANAQWTKTFNEADEYVTILTVDTLGNKSTHMVNVIGLSSQIDTAAPTVAVEKLDKTTDAAGKVTSITGTLSISDSLSGLAEVTVANGANVLYDNKALAGTKTISVPFTLDAKDTDKKIIVNGKDKNGNAINPAWVGDYSKEFSDGGSGGGGGTNPPTPTDTTKPALSYVKSTPYYTDSTNKVFAGLEAQFRVVDETSLKKITYGVADGTNTAEWNATAGTVSKEQIITVKMPNVSDSLTAATNSTTAVVTAIDEAGNSMVGNKALYQVMKNLREGRSETDNGSGSSGGGGTSSSIKSNRDLRKAITGPFWSYDEDYSNAEFKVDATKYGIKSPVTFTLKKGSKEIDDGSSTTEFTYAFEKGVDKVGDYTLVAEFDGYEAKIAFPLEYRDESDLANALKVTQEAEENKVLITMTLSKDKLDDAKKTQWLLPDGTKETGSSVEYYVNATGTYTFKMKLDGETYSHKVNVTSMDGEDGWGDDTNSGGSTSNGTPSTDGTTPYTGNSAPTPGKGLISSITTSQLTIEVPMNNWDANVWSVKADSIPSNVTYSINGNKIVFKVPNTTFQMGFKLVNKDKQYVNYNFPVNALNSDGTNKSDNAQTGGAGAPASSGNGPAAMSPLNLEFKKRRGTVLNDADIL